MKPDISRNFLEEGETGGGVTGWEVRIGCVRGAAVT